MRRRDHALVAVVALSLAVSAAASPAPADRAVKVTFVGDSVPASILHVRGAEGLLGSRGLEVRFDLAVCRRLVQAGCRYHGSIPSTALNAVQRYGRDLGDVLIVNVGYNESVWGYSEGIDRMMRTALAEGASGVVWVTLRETSSNYRRINSEIRSAAGRWPQLTVADWNAHSSGKGWFRDDGLHLTSAGASGLATFLRPFALRAAARPT